MIVADQFGWLSTGRLTALAIVAVLACDGDLLRRCTVMGPARRRGNAAFPEDALGRSQGVGKGIGLGR